MKIKKNIRCDKTNLARNKTSYAIMRNQTILKTSISKTEDQSTNNKTEILIQRLKNENLLLLQKLNRKKAKIAVQKEEINNLRNKCSNRCQESINDEIYSKTQEQIYKLREELSKKEKEINELYIENKVMRNDSQKFGKWKKELCKLLVEGSKEYDYLKDVEFQKSTCEELFEQTLKLIAYLIGEKKTLGEKYSKLLELHNNLVEANGNYSAEYIYKMIDENESMKKDLEMMCSKKL